MSNRGIAFTYRPNEFNGDGYFRDWHDHHSILANVNKRNHWCMISKHHLSDDFCLKDEPLLDFIKYLKSCKIVPCIGLIEEYEEKYGEGSDKFLHSFLTFRLQYFIDYLQQAFNLGLSVEVEF